MNPPDLFAPNPERPSFQMWHRPEFTCNNRWGKNFLYFDELVNNHSKHETKVVVFPKGNPNEVLPIDLNYEKNDCDDERHQMPYLKTTKRLYPGPSFQTMEQELYPDVRFKEYFTPDRGSACCIRVPRDQIPIAPKMADTLPKDIASDDLMVALVHFKTVKRVPEGLHKNLYVSRFIAFLPNEPYTIVARTGGFCFGSLTEAENTWDHPNYHEHWSGLSTMRFGPETVEGCPTIHFPMSMIEKAPNTTNDEKEDSMVIISYGVKDCFSRFVQVKKADIVSMFQGNYTNT